MQILPCLLCIKPHCWMGPNAIVDSCMWSDEKFLCSRSNHFVGFKEITLLASKKIELLLYWFNPHHLYKEGILVMTILCSYIQELSLRNIFFIHHHTVDLKMRFGRYPFLLVRPIVPRISYWTPKPSNIQWECWVREHCQADIRLAEQPIFSPAKRNLFIPFYYFLLPDR